MCQKSSVAKRRAANPDRERAKRAEWEAKNKDRRKAQNAEWYAKNKDRIDAQRAEWYAKNRDRIKVSFAKWHRVAFYGLLDGRYDEMLIEQAGRCDICREPMTGTREPAVDHDHACCLGRRSCGRCVRGLLCRRCNHMLGLTKDDRNVLQAAVAYLSKSSQQ